MLEELGLFDALSLDMAAAKRFASAIEAAYRNCPYHNRRHAAAVTLVFFQILLHSGLLADVEHSTVGKAPGLLYIFAAILAAAVHDINHPGVSSDFRVRTVRFLPLSFHRYSCSLLIHYSSCAAATPACLGNVRSTSLHVKLCVPELQHCLQNVDS